MREGYYQRGSNGNWAFLFIYDYYSFRDYMIRNANMGGYFSDYSPVYCLLDLCSPEDLDLSGGYLTRCLGYIVANNPTNCVVFRRRILILHYAIGGTVILAGNMF